MKEADLRQCALTDDAVGERSCIYNGLVSAKGIRLRIELLCESVGRDLVAAMMTASALL